MPRKHSRQTQYIAGDPSEPQGMHALLRDYLESLRVRNCAEGTIRKRRLQLNDFILWCAERALTRPLDVARPILERYQRHLLLEPHLA